MDSSNESPSDKQPTMKVDEDWKTRVEAENAALDQGPQEESAEENTNEPEKVTGPDLSHLPPADFQTLVGFFTTPSMMALGILPNPATGKPEKQLPLAKHLIDLLGVLDTKTEGNLSDAEKDFLETALHQLRLVYIEQTKQSS